MRSPVLIRPVDSEESHTSALARIDELFSMAQKGTPEGDELDILLDLVGVYERNHFPIDPPSPIEMVRFVMEQRGLRNVDLVPCFGSPARVSEFLNGKTRLTVSTIRKLHQQFQIPLDCLIGED